VKNTISQFCIEKEKQFQQYISGCRVELTGKRKNSAITNKREDWGKMD
jgi:hypothetical protein